MTNDNNNINTLVFESEENSIPAADPLEDGIERDADNLEKFDADEDTFDFERLEGKAEATEKPPSSLQDDVQLRNERISRLQFEIEQLRSRWSGLQGIGCRVRILFAFED